MTVPTHTLLPPAGRKLTAVTTVNGRNYSCAVGSVVSAVPDGDARKLAANGWFLMAEGGGSGTTAQRPVTAPDGRAIRPGTRYLDLTVGFIIVWDGVTWRRPNTGASV